MSERVTGIQPSILKWARERAGYSLPDVARAMNKDVEVIEAWERGKDSPTYVQLEKLAYQIYKRPLAVFFLPKPPEEPDLKKSFRTLPDFEIEALSADTRYALRYANAMQLGLAELTGGINPSQRKIFADIKLGPTVNTAKAAEQIRQYLDIKLEDQIRWGSIDQALRFWRERVEEAGIFVFKRSFKQRDVSGFCLLGKEFPIIYLNNSNPKTRQIFTLCHELAHILSQVNGVTKLDDRYINSLPHDEKQVEQMCNRLAAEILVPSLDFDDRSRGIGLDDSALSSLANFYKVSREVVLRKLLDRRLVDQQYYETKAAQWLREYLEAKPQSEGGGNYYQTQAAYLGSKYLGLVFGSFYQGRLSLEQVADYLGVKTKSVAGLEHAFISKAESA
jgi:Zn-dependent peptidase ImmA (M78 family)